MISKDDCIKIGQIAKPHGIGGQMLVRADAGFDIEDLDHDFLFVDIDGGLVPYRLNDMKIRNGSEAVVKLSFADTQAEARLLSGAAIYIDRSKFNPSTDDVPDGLVVGYEAIDKRRGPLGTIVGIDEQGGTNPLFVIENECRQILIPVTDDFIVEIDDQYRKIHFDLPDGLTEL